MRYLPWLMGGVVGFMLVVGVRHGGDVWARPAVWVVLAAAVLLSFIALTISMALPRDVRLTPLGPGAIDESMNQWLNQFEELGFVLGGPAYEVGMAPPAVIVPLIHREHGCYATVYRTGTQPPKVNCDIVSVLEPPGALTTMPIREGASLPVCEGSFVQCILTGDASQLLQAHLAATQWLRQHGVTAKPAGDDTFEADFRTAINRMRDKFLSNPLHTTLAALYRTVSRRTPHLGPLSEQAAAKSMVERLAARGLIGGRGR